MMIEEVETINVDQAMNDSNLLSAMKEELNATEKNKLESLSKSQSKSQLM